MKSLSLASCLCAALSAFAQSHVPLQPLSQQARQLAATLSSLGQPLSVAEQSALRAQSEVADESSAIAGIEKILDAHVLAVVDINAESRVKVTRGQAKPELVEAGTRLFLVRIDNAAGVTSSLRVTSPEAEPVYITSDNSPEPPQKISKADIRDRWMSIDLYSRDALPERLSGLAVEYRILEIYSRDRGQRSAELSFDVGQGTQDLASRNSLPIVFSALAATPLELRVRDEKGAPSIAAFTIRDQDGRLYPNPVKRLAPDFYFQPQIYRSNGEKILLPAGTYTITCSMGPEYLAQTRQVTVSNNTPADISFALKRWIDPSQFGWYSGDHHVHAAGCSHYQNPAEGVEPSDMVRQIQGEKLNVGAVLTWGPCYYYQKQFFTGKDNPLSKPDELMHYDLEVSGFPSSHAGHLVLLGLKDQDYPHCVRIEQWPTWDLPVLRWAKSQGALAGFAHSGWGLEVKSHDLPNYEMPGFDGIGANEYIVDVTYPDTVDFISAADTPYVWELNIWYHTLNAGFRTRISGETDFPCITDSRVGQGRVYANVAGPLTYKAWLEALRNGRTYVSDGRSHLMNFRVNDTAMGANGSELRLSGKQTVKATVKVSAYLSAPEPLWMASVGNAWTKKPDQLQSEDEIHGRPLDKEPYWHLERARLGNTREVPVELVMNGQPVERKNILADGSVQAVSFDVPIERSSWLAVRILGSSHSNPIFVVVDGKPIRASRQSAEWCLRAVDQCWSQKASKIALRELPDARAAYDHARAVYKKILSETAP